jgi:hypothetical protein
MGSAGIALAVAEAVGTAVVIVLLVLALISPRVRLGPVVALALLFGIVFMNPFA